MTENTQPKTLLVVGSKGFDNYAKLVEEIKTLDGMAKVGPFARVVVLGIEPDVVAIKAAIAPELASMKCLGMVLKPNTTDTGKVRYNRKAGITKALEISTSAIVLDKVNCGIARKTKDHLLKKHVRFKNIKFGPHNEVFDDYNLDVEADALVVEYGFTSDTKVFTFYGTIGKEIKERCSALIKTVARLCKEHGDKVFTIPVDALNKKLIFTPKQDALTIDGYQEIFAKLSDIADSQKLTNVKLPFLGKDTFHRAWNENQPLWLLARLNLDYRFTLVAQAVVTSSAYKNLNFRKQGISFTDPKHEYHKEYNHYLNMKCDDFSDIAMEIYEAHELHGPQFAQALMEFTFSRRGIRRLIKEDLKHKAGHVDNFMDTYICYFKEWAMLDEYPLKNIEKAVLLNPNFNIEELILDLIGIIQQECFGHKSVEFTAVVGRAADITPFGKVIPEIGAIDPSNPDTPQRAEKRAIKMTGDMIGLLRDLGLCSIIPARHAESGTMNIAALCYLSQRTAVAIYYTRFMPPMLCAPKKVTKNSESGLLTQNNHRITTALFRHDDDIALDAMNIAASVPLSINLDILQHEKPVYKLPKKASEMTEHALKMAEENWIAQVNTRYDLVAIYIATGNKFHLNWYCDYRGRIYSEGYHINPQGTDYHKAMIDFAEPREIEGMDKYMDIFKD